MAVGSQQLKRLLPRGYVILCAVLMSSRIAYAHSASDAYLTLTAASDTQGGRTIHGQWDIALRDLDFALKLDDDGNGRITWGELRRHQAAIERYAYANLRVGGGGSNECAIKPVREMVDNHADGAYAALFFEVICARPQTKVSLDYTLFFKIDPSHRGIFVMQSGGAASTAVLSPQNKHIELPL
jgi:hypothetical protein